LRRYHETNKFASIKLQKKLNNMDINELRKNSIEERDGFFKPAVFVDLVATAAAGVVGNVIKSKASGAYVDNLAKEYIECNPHCTTKTLTSERRIRMANSMSGISVVL
jgi:hypothetical protein